MDDTTPVPFSPEVDQRLARLAQAATRGLGESVERELRAHLDDKFLAYRTAAQPISEDDALTLVEKHFGNPAVIHKLLYHVQPAGSSLHILNLVRCLLILGIVTGLAQWACHLIRLATNQLHVFPTADYARDVILAFLPAFIIWSVGAKTGLAASSDEQPRWFGRLPLWLLAAAALLLVRMEGSFRLVTISMAPSPVVASLMSHYAPIAVVIAWVFLVQCSSAVVWAWWCQSSSPSTSSKPAAFGLAGWVFFQGLYVSCWLAQAAEFHFSVTLLTPIAMLLTVCVIVAATVYIPFAVRAHLARGSAQIV